MSIFDPNKFELEILWELDIDTDVDIGSNRFNRGQRSSIGDGVHEGRSIIQNRGSWGDTK